MGLNETGCLYIDCVSNDPTGCGFDAEQSDCMVDDKWHDNYLANEVYNTAIDEIRNQYDATLSAISSQSQKSGILLAFSSIMFIDLFRLYDESMLWYLLFIVMLSLFAVGIYNAINGLAIPLGIKLSKIINYVVSGKLYNLRISILNGKTYALFEVQRISSMASILILVQSLLLLVCTILFIYMEVNLNVVI